MNRNLKIAIEEAQQKKDEVIPILTKTFTTEISTADIQPERKDSTENKDIKKINLLTEEESEIWQMTKKESEYLARSLI
jgi:hypothetical protein